MADEDRTARFEGSEEHGEVLAGAASVKPDALAVEPLRVDLVEAPADHALEEPAHANLLAEARLEAVPLILLRGPLARFVEGPNLDVALPADGYALREFGADELVDEALVPAAHGSTMSFLPALVGDHNRVGSRVRL